MLIVFFSVLSAVVEIGSFVTYFGAISVARGAAASVFEVIDRKPLIDSSSTEGKKPTDVQGVVSFKGVVFNYPSRPEIPILRSIFFSIPSGQTGNIPLMGGKKEVMIGMIGRLFG